MFRCSRCDFKEIIEVTEAPEILPMMMGDVAEMIGFHATNILPQLNGFSGYDTLSFYFK